AAAAERARSAVEDSVKQLRDEVTSAFARWRPATPSNPPLGDGRRSAPPDALGRSERTSAVPSSSPRQRASAPPIGAATSPDPSVIVTETIVEVDEADLEPDPEPRTVKASEPPLTRRGAAAEAAAASAEGGPALPESLLDEEWPTPSSNTR